MTTELRFECTRCQRCCARPGEVFFSAPEAFLAAAFLEIPLLELIDTYMHRHNEGWRIDVQSDAPCPFLTSQGCAIHPVKPSQCRTYPFWPEIIGEAGAWDAEAEHCPGIGQGPLYDADRIAAITEGEDDTLENLPQS
ncbi:YkgJ family cysteine cluster protein [Lujinxingia litoralis]|nr:YkgJ family cysteine cluster protein [Lujinxingia litoralis]